MPRASALLAGLLVPFALALPAVSVPARAAEHAGGFILEEDAEGADKQFPEGTARAELSGAILEPGEAGVGAIGRKVLLLGSEMQQEAEGGERARPLHIGKSIAESLKAAGREADVVKAEIMSAAGSEDILYAEWLRGVSGIQMRTTPLATLRVTQLESKLELACEKTVVAGEPIKLYVKSVGGADLTWRVFLVYPDSTASKWDLERAYTGAIRYHAQDISAGKKILGGVKGKIRTITFDTYPADRGKLLGILVVKPDYAEFQHTFWVKVQ